MKYLYRLTGGLLLLLMLQLTCCAAARPRPVGQAPRPARHHYHRAQRHNARDRARKPHYTFFW